jgi:hypothetical protein
MVTREIFNVEVGFKQELRCLQNETKTLFETSEISEKEEFVSSAFIQEIFVVFCHRNEFETFVLPWKFPSSSS